jgi:hypothetical protein
MVRPVLLLPQSTNNYRVFNIGEEAGYTAEAGVVAQQAEAAGQEDYGDWEQYFDETSQQNYWYNASTGETRWA